MKKIEYMKLPCKLCGGNNFEKMFTKVDRDSSLKKPVIVHIAKCKKCGLIAANPRIKNIYDIYNKNYYKEEFGSYESEQGRIEMGTAAFSWMQRIMDRKKGKVIDLGCGSGVLLNSMLRAGNWDVHGLDITNYIHGPAKTKAKFHKMSLEKIKLKEKFDLATMVEVAEHLTDPRKTFRDVHSILNPGGWLFISTANLESILTKRRGSAEEYYKAAHVTYWSPKTIRECLEKCGFQVHVTTMYNGHWRQFRSSKKLSELKRALAIGLLRRIRFGDKFLIGGMVVFARKRT